MDLFKVLLFYLLLIQDTGISVRKRVIKILRDICLEQPAFSKITEMCVKMIRRVNDEEGIKVWIYICFLLLPFCYHDIICTSFFKYRKPKTHKPYLTETSQWDIPEVVVYTNSSPWQRNHDSKDPQHHWCGRFELCLCACNNQQFSMFYLCF